MNISVAGMYHCFFVYPGTEKHIVSAPLTTQTYNKIIFSGANGIESKWNNYMKIIWKYESNYDIIYDMKMISK